jgi:predicted esterase
MAGKRLRIHLAALASAFVIVSLGSPAHGEAAASTVDAAAPLAPLAGEWLESFGVLGFVSPPTGSTEPRPVVIAVHGRMDRPDWACSEWRAVFGPRPFIVCPQGSVMPPGYAWTGGTAQVRAAIDRLLDAAQAKYGAHLDRDHRVFAGFSQGAILSAPLLCDDDSPYAVAILQEGFPNDLARRCATKHGRPRRVILGCSQGGCAGVRRPLSAALTRIGIDARVNDAGVQGHTMNDVIVASLQKDLRWLLEGASGWEAVALPP